MLSFRHMPNYQHSSAKSERPKLMPDWLLKATDERHRGLICMSSSRGLGRSEAILVDTEAADL